mmetsp:Transcript_23605/g.36307  ORF Transcript_23605/g.36307 Transcript_23605/m.36307 type:complete len:99 (+) Transcript_23605:329-625(+)
MDQAGFSKQERSLPYDNRKLLINNDTHRSRDKHFQRKLNTGQVPKPSASKNDLRDRRQSSSVLGGAGEVASSDYQDVPQTASPPLQGYLRSSEYFKGD